jgi:hypothetical protein
VFAVGGEADAVGVGEALVDAGDFALAGGGVDVVDGADWVFEVAAFGVGEVEAAVGGVEGEVVGA